MNHLNEEQLTLHFYGEIDGPELERHLAECEACRAAYLNLQRVLNSVDAFPVPEPAAGFERRVWAAVGSRLKPARAGWFSWKPLAVAASLAILVTAAFLAGRGWQRITAPAPADAGQVRERVLLVALGDHLERSRIVLAELVNAGAPEAGHLDISYEQQTAEDLLESNRLFRQTAASAGDMAAATLLDDLERVLLEIAHGPSAMSPRQLEDLRREIEDQQIVFKVKVFRSQVEQREEGEKSLAGSRNKS